MSTRTLPPPPPPPHIRAWPDRGALLADRARAMDILIRRYLALLGLLWLWLLAAGCFLGWTLAVMGLAAVSSGNAVDLIFGVVYLLLGLVALGLSGLGLALGARRDRMLRERLRSWAALDRDPATDGRRRVPGRALLWLLTSAALCVLALVVGVLGVAEFVTGVKYDDAGTPFATVFGATAIPGMTGTLGVAKALGHYRWERREFGAGAGPGLRSPGRGRCRAGE
ncbi:hypothetical protein [Streptomyces sp. H27-D2]|uniref:hypothetical protein n=1 Tax=Streptomyces sp. H27-D2 TaxID=3046304 RepID=UPI002DB5C285|nr:hypothetical protein [Streptomyces sp. H27-D2]MEC4017438.1 hypothetical protein [Streptomyces sp. H27-D2]